MKNYQRAVRYATKLIKDYNAPYSPRDLVHDSFLMWDKYQDSNLFDNKEGTVMKVVKNMHFNNLNAQCYQKNGEKRKRVQLNISDDYNKNEDLQDEVYIPGEKFVPIEVENPYNILISQEYKKNFYDSISKFDGEVLSLKEKGYQNKEIVKLLDTHNVKVTKSIKNIKKQMHTKSPFNGCNITVVKRVKRAVFEAEKEKYLEEFEMGEGSDYNEYYVLMTSKLSPNEGLLIKEKGSD